MLGSVIKGRGWNWTAVGKHPAAMDFIRLGIAAPLLDAVADWVAKGYDEWLRRIGRSQSNCSWRFWLRGAQKETLVCGLVKDCSDRIGRPYPLLIMGQGPLKRWEKDWGGLPVRLNRTWKHLESIAARRFDDAHAMEEALEEIGPVDGEALANPESRAGGGQTALKGKATTCREQLLADGFAMMALDGGSETDTDQVILACHDLLPGCCPGMPRGVFIGGTPQQSYLSIVQHPLSVSDFIRLWSV